MYDWSQGTGRGPGGAACPKAGRFESELDTASPTEVSSRQVQVRTLHCQPYRGLKPAGSSQNSTLPALERSQAGRFESELDTASPTEVSSRQVRVRTRHCQPYRGLKPAGSSQNSTLPALQRSQAGRFESKLDTASPTEVSSRQVRVRTRHCQPYRGLKPAGSSQNSTLPALQRSQAGRFESEPYTASPTEVPTLPALYRGLTLAGSSQNPMLPVLLHLYFYFSTLLTF